MARISQYDAEFVAELTNKLNEVSTSGVSEQFRREFNKIDAMRMKLWQKAFGEHSNWRTKRGRNGEVVVEEKD